MPRHPMLDEADPDFDLGNAPTRNSEELFPYGWEDPL